MDRGRTLDFLKRFDFRPLFIQELGWEHHESKLEISVDGKSYSLQAIAHKRGMVAFQCAVPIGDVMPEHAFRKMIERQVAKTAHEHLIVFTDAGKTVQIWQWVKREPGKPNAYREHHYQSDQSGEALFQKLEKIAFTLEEEEKLGHLDVTRRTRQAFDVEKVTKKFFEQFQLEHKAFLKFIDGIEDTGAHEWYASIMLNRLMFIYFVQRKGFLDGDKDYLRNRLEKNRKEHGKDKFYSFYRYFLLRLFHDGLGSKERSPDLDMLLGRIPYLNGGLFEKHQVEREFPKIKIPDSAFERIFAFFDKFHWHLDERPVRNDNEINPDVLGHIFEKYINQKEMGAYYTKEEITEYISKNTVLPFLFDAARAKCKVAFENPDGPTVWDLLREDPDQYINLAVRHGVGLELPLEIAAGVDTSKPNLIQRRKTWNKPAPAEFALPMETWRDVIARRQRYEEVRKKLVSGEIREANDFITHNLDLRQFTQDLIANCEGPDLLRAIWHGIEKMTVLDPTCGSGAFLFAVLNILEPLYEGCLERMASFIADDEISKPQTPEDSIRALIASGEGFGLEFKSTARWNVKDGKADKIMEQVIVKTVAGFLNSNGGDLLIGVQDDGSIIGIETDLQLFRLEKRNRDGYELWLMNLLLETYGKQHSANLRIAFVQIDGKDVCRVTAFPASEAVYVKESTQEALYVRTGNSTRALSTSEVVPYHRQRFINFKPPVAMTEAKKSINPKKYSDFREALKEVEKHPNLRYFIFKAIILKNLYGVDVMEEAVEICKLRLFLKLAAQVDPNTTHPNLGIEPLPDIDFNIRAGNTLVGFATRAELDAVGESDLFLAQEVKGVIEAAEDADSLFNTFQKSQADGESPGDFKRQLSEKFGITRRKCDIFLAEIHEHNISKKPTKLNDWRRSHLPFHWFVEFYGIMNKGGFDVIIGNPPYVEYKDVKDTYKVRGFETMECGDLYAFTMERAYSILQRGGRVGLIVPVSIFCVDGFRALQTLTFKKLDSIWTSSYSNRPAQLFDGAQKRLTIVIGKRGDSKTPSVHTTVYYRWQREEFPNLFAARVYYAPLHSNFSVFPASLEKLGSKLEVSAFSKLAQRSERLGVAITSVSKHHVYYTRKFGYFLAFLNFVPRVTEIRTHKQVSPSELKDLSFPDNVAVLATVASLSSTTFFWFWNVLSDCRNLNRRDILAFPINPITLAARDRNRLADLGMKYLKALKGASYEMEKSGLILQTFEYSSTKLILNEIDAVLAEYYGFTEEELDFIINYDIKYRMGREVEDGEE